MSRYNTTKLWRFAKPWLPTVALLILSALLGLGFISLVHLNPSSYLPGLPLLASIGTFAGAVFFSVNAVKETVVTRMFYPSAKTGYRKELRGLKKDRAKYIRYAFGDRSDPSTSYLRNIQMIDMKIGELTGKGYDEPDYSPATQHRG